MNRKEEQWLEVLYRETFPAVAAMIHRQGGDLHTAKDLFHDALIIYLEKYNSNRLQIRVSPAAYLTGITKILWLKLQQQQQDIKNLDNQEDLFSVPADYYSPPPAPVNIMEHIKTAGKKCLQLLQAFYYDRLSMEEIKTGFQYKTIHSATVQKYKCLEKIREQVKQTDLYAETTH